MPAPIYHFRPRPILIFALSLIGGGIFPLVAASPPPLSFSEALRRAAEHSPALIAQSYQERVADALVEQAGLRANPTLDVSVENFSGTGSVRGTRGLEATIQATQTLERGGKRDKRLALAGRERDLAANEYAVRRAEVLSATATSFLDALAAQERLKLAKEPLQLAHETVATVDLRVKAGAESPAESARARAALATAEAEYARAEAAVIATRASLSASWGGSPEEIHFLVGEIRVPESLPNPETLLARLSEHPRLNVQRSMIDGRRAALELERAQAVQDISVGGGVRFIREGTDAAFVAGVSVPLPIRNRNQGNIRAARETLAGAEQGVRVIEVELRTMFTAAWQDLSSAHKAARSLKTHALPATEEAYKAVRHAYEQGQLGLIDVLDAQRALVVIHREILDAEITCIGALIRIEALTDPAFSLTTTIFSSP